MNKKLLAVLLLISGVILGYAGSILMGDDVETINPAEAQDRAEQFVNQSLIPSDSDQSAQVKNIEKEGGIYKVSVELGGQSITSYITRNGKTFFPQGMDIDQVNEEAENNTQASNDQEQQRKIEVSTKKDIPTVELFTMSYCPYGTQMEKAILPVIEVLGDEMDFDLQFVDYLMHEEKELEENLRQHCIEKEQPSELFAYLDCFLGSEDAGGCLQEAGIEQSSLESCMEETNEEYRLTEKFNDESTYKNGYPPFDINKTANEEYGVSGSPTLVINGETVQPPRTPDALLATICSGFNDQPEACSQELPTSTPAPGFGSGEGSASSESCQ